jgi:cysteine-rich repeat protein
MPTWRAVAVSLSGREAEVEMATNVPRVIVPKVLGAAAFAILVAGACSSSPDRSDGSRGRGGSGGSSESECGDGFEAPDEECDDGNTLAGDCCSAACEFEPADTACDDGSCSNGDADGTCNGAGQCISAFPVATPSTATGQCLVFLSSGSYLGDFGGLSGADAICQELAESEDLPGRYKAWLSDSQTSAIDRLAHSVVPYVRVDGEIVAQNWDDLTNGSGLTHAISVSEGGYDWYNVCAQCFWFPGGCGAVWTATAPNGFTERNTCADWTSQEQTGGEGIYCLETGTSWTQWPDGGTSVDCHHARSLYCFQQ